MEKQKREFFKISQIKLKKKKKRQLKMIPFHFALVFQRKLKSINGEKKSSIAFRYLTGLMRVWLAKRERLDS